MRLRDVEHGGRGSESDGWKPGGIIGVENKMLSQMSSRSP
jgi:hypothetical protein